MSIKTYSYNDTTQLTPHFNVKEFKCQCGKSHDILISEELVNKLEDLFDALDCSKIIITSGYRCAEHDKAVGGSSTGQHTKGTAADICCYAQDGSKISSKQVCCKAQDLGFTGIANITSEYVYTHVDVRTSGKWYGNEVINNSTITNDFYSYYGISKSTTTNSTKLKGIDVSYYQGNIDWTKVAKAGYDFAILRAGYGKEISQKDSKFEEYYGGCKNNGIPCGVYWYSYALTPSEAKTEAKVCLEAIKGKTFEYPIYIDLEEKDQFATGKENCSAIVEAFCSVLEDAGYFAGLYCSTYYLNNYITDSVKNKYVVWCAQYNNSCTYSGNYGIWQYGVSEKGAVSGISGQCDLDYCYVDYPTTIKAAGKNGFTSTSTEAQTEKKGEENKTELEENFDDDTLEQILEQVKLINEKLK